MQTTIALNQDFHVHSTFSDGVDTIEANVRRCEELGVSALGCVDHVRRDTRWVPEFVDAVRSIQTDVELLAGLEVKILNTRGDLDMPQAAADIADRIYVADHRFPLPDQCVSPREIRNMFADGSLPRSQAIELYTSTIHRVLDRFQRVTLAHIFSIFPKVKLSEDELSDDTLVELADHIVASGAIVEVDERWRCPSLRTTQTFLSRGVTVVASSDAHRKSAIGSYVYVRDLATALTASSLAASSLSAGSVSLASGAAK